MRRLASLSCAAAALALAAAPSAAHATGGDQARIAQGLAIAPVSLNLTGLSKAKVGLGSYLVNALGGCNDCHTSPPYATGGDPYAGERTRINKKRYLAGGVSFGPFVSPNLTPDGKGRPAGLTFRHQPAQKDLGRRALRAGRGHDVIGKIVLLRFEGDAQVSCAQVAFDQRIA